MNITIILDMHLYSSTVIPTVYSHNFFNICCIMFELCFGWYKRSIYFSIYVAAGGPEVMILDRMIEMFDPGSYWYILQSI